MEFVVQGGMALRIFNEPLANWGVTGLYNINIYVYIYIYTFFLITNLFIYLCLFIDCIYLFPLEPPPPSSQSQ